MGRESAIGCIPFFLTFKKSFHLFYHLHPVIHWSWITKLKKWACFMLQLEIPFKFKSKHNFDCISERQIWWYKAIVRLINFIVIYVYLHILFIYLNYFDFIFCIWWLPIYMCEYHFVPGDIKDQNRVSVSCIWNYRQL